MQAQLVMKQKNHCKRRVAHLVVQRLSPNGSFERPILLDLILAFRGGQIQQSRNRHPLHTIKCPFLLAPQKGLRFSNPDPRKSSSDSHDPKLL